MTGLAPETDASGRDGAGLYRSGVAARLAGVPVNTLRVWERRYKVVGPSLSTGRQRLYSLADVRRLTLIKQLVDMGHRRQPAHTGVIRAWRVRFYGR